MSDILRPDWPAPANIHAFTTTRLGPGVSELPFYRFNLGARCGDKPADVNANREALRREYQLPGEPLWLHQVHGIEVVSDDGTRGSDPLADAAVTEIPGSVLAVLTADCLPVLFCNTSGTEVAAAHAGWRGLAAGMLEATVAAMQSPPETLLAWLGPAAGAARYEVGEEVRQAFVSVDADAASAFTPTRPGHYRIDMPAIARQRLAACGVTQVYGGEHCTLADIRFYSHRREQRTGRMASLIWMA
jgi:YfiH family protein